MLFKHIYGVFSFKQEDYETIQVRIYCCCKAKYGCEANEQVKPRTNKKGELIGRKRSDHGELFDKKRRKKMGR